jgi:2-dehydropantoate 2-reductase
MKHVDDLQARFGPARVLGGVCRVSTTLDSHGRIVHLAPLHELVYGELDGERTARIEALHAFMSDAGFDARLSTHIAQDLWNKWILLATLGGICALARGNVSERAASISCAPSSPRPRPWRRPPASRRASRSSTTRWACSRPPARR